MVPGSPSLPTLLGSPQEISAIPKMSITGNNTQNPISRLWAQGSGLWPLIGTLTLPPSHMSSVLPQAHSFSWVPILEMLHCLPVTGSHPCAVLAPSFFNLLHSHQSLAPSFLPCLPLPFPFFPSTCPSQLRPHPLPPGPRPQPSPHVLPPASLCIQPPCRLRNSLPHLELILSFPCS